MRQPDGRHCTLVLLLCAGLLLPLVRAANAQDTGKRLQEIEKEIRAGKKKSEVLDERAKSLGQAITDVTHARVEMAKSIREIEQRMHDIEDEIAILDTSEQQKRAALVDGRRTYGQLLTALQRMSRLPPEAVIAYPTEPSDIVRAAIVLRGVVPQIEGRAISLRGEIESLADTRAAIADRRKELAAAGVSLRNERGELEKQLASVNAARRETLAERQAETARMDRLGREAEGLRELFDKLDAERTHREEEAKAAAKAASAAATQAASLAAKAEPALARRQDAAPKAAKSEPKSTLASAAPFAPRRMSDARGDLPMPAVGRISGHYGEPMSTGISRKGIDIETRAGAQVVAPYDGKVVFAGPFRAYGLLLIIEHSEGYHTLLAGMDRIDAEVGQILLSGEPVGTMSPAADAPPSLYVELRRNGQPINPLPWLAARKGKANG